jgi:hypothetical protein
MWCASAEEFQESYKALGLFLVERGFERIRSNGTRGYVGLRVTTNALPLGERIATPVTHK